MNVIAVLTYDFMDVVVVAPQFDDPRDVTHDDLDDLLIGWVLTGQGRLHKVALHHVVTTVSGVTRQHTWVTWRQSVFNLLDVLLIKE